jgi:hypothetical protein
MCLGARHLHDLGQSRVLFPEFGHEKSLVGKLVDQDLGALWLAP